MLNRNALKWIRRGIVLVTLLGLFMIVAPVVGQTASRTGATMPYSGQLSGEDGKPVKDGKYDFTFTFYDAAEGGNLIWSEAQGGVPVQGGAFVVLLGSENPVPDMSTKGNLWLEIGVRAPQDVASNTLNPRQPLRAASLASPAYLGATSGACVHDHLGEVWNASIGWSNSGLKINNNLNGPSFWGVNSGGGNAIRGDGYGSVSIGVYGSGDSGVAIAGNSGTNNGVVGGTNAADKSGVLGHSSAGVGVTGTSDTNDGVVGYSNLIDKSGVYGHSDAGIGVTGQSTNYVGVLGKSGGSGYAAVDGESTNGIGVVGITTSNYSGYSGVQGINMGTGYGGYFTSNGGKGIYASGASAAYAGYFENPGGAANPGVYVNGTLLVTGAKSGYVVDIAINAGPEPLETGDVVVLTGYGDPVLGQIPLVKVMKAAQAGSKAVMGVVDQPFAVPTAQSGQGQPESLEPSSASALAAEGTAIAQGHYLSVVTLGAFKVIKVDASFLAVQIGDLLVASSNPGFAMASEDPKLGSVIGKALGECPSGTCLIPVLVTLK